MKLGRRALAVLAIVAAVAGPAWAQPAAARLEEAQRRLMVGAYLEVLQLTLPLVADPVLPRADRAEAYRLRGLAQFFLGRTSEAEEALYQFLRLDPEAHLDPALVPPDAVSFLENIRARHEGELRALKPRTKRRSRALNLLPPAGQFQNEQRAKGWTIGTAEVVLLATNITTYVVLANECEADLTCAIDRSTARALQLANLISGGLLVGVYLYGVIDGFHIQNCLEAAERPSLTVVPQSGGGSLVFGMGF